MVAEPAIAGMMIMCDRAGGRRGERWNIERDELWHPGLDRLRGGAPLFLVDVRPETDLFVTAVIEASRFDAHGWAGGAADVVLVDIGHLRSRLRFDTGMGVTGSKG